MRNWLFIFFLFISGIAAAQTMIEGNILDRTNDQPVQGVSVFLLPNKQATASDASGNFNLRYGIGDTAVLLTAIGYAPQTISIPNLLKEKNIIRLNPRAIELSSVTISSRPGDQFQAISKIDMAMRDLSNSQEVLRLVPGLFIGQHQGGGKAEQIFLRGFDCDHGTDISINSDGVPVNLVSHAHGQGYADSHFIIPETIGYVNFKKGPYYAEKGDFCTTGYVDFHTLNSLPQNLVKVEGGMYNTLRVLGMFNLLGGKSKSKQQSWYTAAEYRYTDSYFDNSQFFNRFNFFTKYYGRISKKSWLSFSASSMYSKWNASGQIPDRAVSEGLIGFYGAIDPNEGGVTSRTNANAQLTTTLSNGDLITNQFYYSYYTFDLHTNFTFFLVDTLNGDEIRQKESRNLSGYKGNYEHVGYIGGTRLTTDAGLQFRGDATNNSQLAHTEDRYTLLDNIKLGNITELAASIYLLETFRFNDRFSVNAGLRFDQFHYAYNNKLISDTSFPGLGIYKTNDNSLNPKLSFYYQESSNLEFYLNLGKGFHSNDARAVVSETNRFSGNPALPLPAAYGFDLGSVFKPTHNLIINAAFWYIRLDQEYVYGGDGGTVDFSGNTQRVGFDFSARYQPLQNLFVDLDLNYAHGRAVDEKKGDNYIPLAPVWTSTGGITYTRQQGFNGSLRYRYMADRPANEDNSLKAIGYFVSDLVLNYTKKKYEIGLTINNVLNTKWKETQFTTLTRLKNEPSPIDEICFTPGTPFAMKMSLTIFF